MSFHNNIVKDLNFANLLDTRQNGVLVHTVNTVLTPAFAHLPSTDDSGILVHEKFAPRRKAYEKKLIHAFITRMQKALNKRKDILEPEHQGRIFALYLGYLFARQQQTQNIRSVKRFKTIQKTFVKELYEQFSLHSLSHSVHNVDYDVESMLTGALQEYDSWLKEL